MNNSYPSDDVQEHMPAVFVGGPIQHALCGGGMREAAQLPIEAVHAVVRSLGIRLFSAHIAEKFGATTHAVTPDDVAQRDYAWMSACALFVAVLPCDANDRLIRTDGTHIELGWASALAKPILVLAHKRTHPQLSHLVKGLRSVSTVDLIDLDEVLERPPLLQETILTRLQQATALT